MSERASLLVSVAFLAAVAMLSTAALDVATWYRTNRKLQVGTDTAALTAAQALPDSTSRARALAGTGRVSFSTTVVPNDTVTVERKAASPGLLGGVLTGSPSVSTKAVARAGLPSRARWAAPVAVDARIATFSSAGCPCWRRQTTLELSRSAQLLDLDGSRGGTAPSAFATWIREGFDRYMQPGWYHASPVEKVSSPLVRSALMDRYGSELLLPVYRQVRRSGEKVEYHVVGWSAFHLSGLDWHASSPRLHGWFERVIWEGMQSESRSENDFGVRTVALVS
jgi:hypothetical protein